MGHPNRKAMALIVLVLTLFLVVAYAVRPKCRYAFGGRWVSYDADSPGDVFFAFTETPIDLLGKRQAVINFQYLVDDYRDPTYAAVAAALGLEPFSGAKFRTPRNAEVVATGKETFEYQSISYGVNEAGDTVYLSVTGGEGRWIDQDTREVVPWVRFYNDANNDGIPDGDPFVSLPPYLHLVFVRMPWLS